MYCMNKHQLKNQTEKVITSTKDALTSMYEALNQGQKKKILKNEAVAELFRRFGVEVNENV